jgi:hypothetical protein
VNTFWPSLGPVAIRYVIEAALLARAPIPHLRTVLGDEPVEQRRFRPVPRIARGLCIVAVRHADAVRVRPCTVLMA